MYVPKKYRKTKLTAKERKMSITPKKKIRTVSLSGILGTKKKMMGKKYKSFHK